MPDLPGGRDPTQSLQIDPEDDEPSHPSLALGTHEKREERTRVESPGAQKRTPPPPQARGSGNRPPPIPSRNPDEPERIGTTLGSYRILELLGKGGMGYVFRAEHVKLGREVALKQLRSDYARRRDAVARFFQEARTVNRVRHRNIVDVTDFVELEDGTTFIIMELLSGQSLGKWARTGVDMPRALAVLVQICDGLGAAHQVSVVHRDLKPDNIIVIPTSDGAELVKLLDFGVAKLLNRDDEDVGFQTAAGSVIGTPAYMSPEQAGGMLVDARSDIYSLGAIMYELFCGQPMFRGRSFGEYVRKHLTEMPLPPRATPGGAQIDSRLELLIMRCLEKDPNMRFPGILELRDALLGMLGGMDTHPPGLATVTGSNARVGPTLVPHAMQTILPQVPIPYLPTPASGMHPSLYYSQYASQIAPPPPPAATPWWVWFVGGALAVGLGILAAVWYAGRTEPTVVAAPQPVAKPVLQPIVTPQPADPLPLPPLKAKFFEVKFDSLPSGGVFADGHSAELCRTPCAFNIEIDDGGPVDRRTFVVRATGYKDTSIVIDLASPKHNFHVTLEHDVAIADPAVEKPIAKRPVGKKGPKTEKKPGTTAEPEVKKPDPAINTKKDDLIDPTDGTTKRPVKPEKKPTTIDPTELADPFKKKR
jgi:serine/threonine protein kinase